MIYFLGWLTALIIFLASLYRMVYIFSTGGNTDPIFSQLMLCAFCGCIVLYGLKQVTKRPLSLYARWKRDQQRLNQLQVLPPNATLQPIQTENIIALEPGEYACASVDAVLVQLNKTAVSVPCELIITSNSLAYADGTIAGVFSLPLEDLLDVVPTNEGFTINGQDSKHVFKIKSSTQRQIFDLVFQRIMQQRRQAEQQAFA